MDYKNTLPWILIFLVGSVQAECYIRSTSQGKSLGTIEKIADLKQEVVPADSKNICRVSFRAYVNGKWYLALGEEVAQTWSNWHSACAKAQQSAKTNLLESATGATLSLRQDMFCTDEPIPKTKRIVNVGDIVKESEVQPHPTHFDNFRFRGSLCRWFIESTPQAGRIDLNQGIMCRLSDEVNWKVVDKW